ncbi:MAG: hypothetical protein IJ471_08385 [Eubacterium sp.]|nr:hypothetical protein [Eubacterium sp.]
MNHRTSTKGDHFAIAALICGIFGCIFMCSVIAGVFFGSLGIIFALLARGDSQKLNPPYRAGFILCIIAIVASVLIGLASIHNMITTYGSIGNAIDAFMQTLNETSRQMYGITLDEMMEMYQ